MIKITSSFSTGSLVILSIVLGGSAAATQATNDAGPGAPGATDAEDRGWPRQFEAGENEIVVCAPQVDVWPGFERITFRSAITVAPKGYQTKAYGIIRVSAQSKVSVEDRLVVLTDRRVEEISFPDVVPAEAERLRAIVMSAMPPERPQTVSLDRVVAAMDPSKVDVRTVDVNLAPPKIIASDVAAVMVIFLGKPRFKPVPNNDLMFAINTNWDLFLDPAAQKYYLLDDRSWLVTSDLEKGPWAAATSLPPSLSKLPADENWNDVRAAIPGEPEKVVPLVYVSREPAELIVTEGGPELSPITGTRLMLVANTDSTVLFDTSAKQYYFLTAGRWFKSAALAGPWESASTSLPEDFKKIPEDSDAAHVLAAVPGTADANEAIVMASIPEKATIDRAGVTLDVTYDGAPKFRPIESTGVVYAYNSPFSVFLVDGKYYCCNNGVWFVAQTPTGAWAVCDAVPSPIYRIPPTSPKYNVTYVRVYDSTPTTVTFGYTAGYSGATVAATGVVMFGLGLLVGAAFDDDDCWGYHCSPCYYSYGCGAYWNGGCGGYVCGSSVDGPYGGAGRVAAYNPATGIYSRAGYVYGPNGGAGYRAAYNPSTGVAAGRVGGSTPYGSWGRSAVTNGDEWVRGGQKTTARGTVGAIQGSGGASVVTAQGRFGNGATIAKSQDGDLYAAKDGNVYKRGDDGWQQTRNGSDGPRSAPRDPPKAPADRSFADAQPQRFTELRQEAAVRDRGDFNAARTRDFKGGRSAGFTPARGGGGGRGRGGRR